MARSPRRIPRCYVCGFQITELHHIVPRSLGGRHDSANLMALCPNHHAAMHILISEYRWQARSDDHLPEIDHPRRRSRRHRAFLAVALSDAGLVRAFNDVFLPCWDAAQIPYRRPDPATTRMVIDAVARLFFGGTKHADGD